MPSLKITVLAMASAVAAVPNYGHGHSRFHKSSSAAQAQGTGNVKPYPAGPLAGGWSGYNTTAAALPTGAGGDTTIDVTSTSTTTLVKTVVIKASQSAAPGVPVQEANVDNEKCGPATVTVTASEKVTVTVTPGGGADAPKSSNAVVESKSQGEGYGVPSSGVAPAAPTPEGEGEEAPAKTTPVVEVPSKVDEGYPVQTTAVVPPKAPEEEKPSSIYEKPVEEPTSVVVPPVVTSSEVASPSATPSKAPGGGNTYTGTKRGLAYNDAHLCKSLGAKFGFGYNWGQVENNDIGAAFIPMMHGPTKSTAQEWLDNVEKAVKKGSTAVMGFNEPDHAQQAALDTNSACSAWKEYMNPIKAAHPDITIIGPSVTNGPPPMGLDWLSRFHETCPDAIVDAANIHFYDIFDASETGTLSRFKAQVEKAAKLYGKPVWITEFGLNPGSASAEQASQFLKEAMDFCDASPDVQGYAWFMVGEGEHMLNAGSGLSALGELYAS